MTTPIRVLAPDDPYGKNSIPGMRSIANDRRLRRSAHGRKEFFHRTKNGIKDPITFFHIVDALLNIEPNHAFQTRELVERLSQSSPQLVWDTVTVGRVLNDIADSLEEANGKKYLIARRRYDGMIYSVTELPEGRAALAHLLDDLYALCKELLAKESDGEAPPRQTSPMERCPSVRVMA